MNARTTPPIEDLANALRILAMDCVEHAGSGHPGMPMGMADIATALWHRHLRHNANNPGWADRDRFVVSNGHGSALLYSLLHLTGYDVGIEELKRFRRMGSTTPGHPEFGCTPGVETTTGPLGQGLANAVGMALAERLLASEFNTDDDVIVDHHTYVFLGDGCLMEGLSHEACSLAGTWHLNKLIAFWDDNGISIDGHVRGWFTDNTPARFAAYGWNVIEAVDGHDIAAVDAAICRAKTHATAPTLICCRTRIGHGAPRKAGTAECHGSPLGELESRAVREALQWTHAPFDVPEAIRTEWDASARGSRLEEDWRSRFARYASQHPAKAAEFVRRMAGRLPEGFSYAANHLVASNHALAPSIASRKASQEALDRLAPMLPELLGGSADLAGSNLTLWKAARPLSDESGGNYLHYGVREFGMAAIMNGLSLHGGFRPYGGTFVVFSDYARNAMRMAALMKLNVVYVLTHDSIGLGADGPTHQPVEHIASLRLIPNMDVWRPCDAVETAAAWQAALTHDGTPTCLILSRQTLQHQPRSASQLPDIRRGGYVLRSESGALDVVLIATGSEVQLAVQAAEVLAASGMGARVVSMPSTRVFDQQPSEYRESVLPSGVKRVAVEAGTPEYWRRYVGLSGRVVGIATYGESGDADDLFDHFGITVDAVVRATREILLEEPPSAGALTEEARSTREQGRPNPGSAQSTPPRFA